MFDSVCSDNLRHAIREMNMQTVKQHNDEAERGLHTFTVGENEFSDWVKCIMVSWTSAVLRELYFVESCACLSFIWTDELYRYRISANRLRRLADLFKCIVVVHADSSRIQKDARLQTVISKGDNSSSTSPSKPTVNAGLFQHSQSLNSSRHGQLDSFGLGWTRHESGISSDFVQVFCSTRLFSLSVHTL